ncbi:MAG: RHS repeat-associated protein [Candidatus Binatia bacterium]|jgi:RHS repeat-associated protein
MSAWQVPRASRVYGSAGKSALACWMLLCQTSFVATAIAGDFSAALGGAPGTATGDSGTPFLGLAATPGADSFTGTASTSIGIEAAPGRAAMTPSIRLVYSSGGGPSPYGHGWDLPLPRIERSTKRGVPGYDELDEYILFLGGGAMELQPDPDHPARFVPKIQGSFPRIGFDSKTNSWTVIDRSGTEYRFGESFEARVANGQAAASTFSWMIERMQDAVGNTIDFRYLPSTPAGSSPGSVAGSVATAQPDFIEYGGNTKAGSEHFARVSFLWNRVEAPRVPRESFRTGMRQVFDRDLGAVETSIDGEIVRRYSFELLRDVKTGSVTLRSAGLDARGERRDLDVSVPATVFQYTPTAATGWPTAADGVPADTGTTFESPGAIRDDGDTIDFDTFDLDGDAIVDYVDPTTTPPSYRRGSGNGFESPRPWTWPGPKQIRSTNGRGNMESNVFDIDGDALPDLVDGRRSACGPNNASVWCVWRNTGNGFSPTPIPWSAPLDYVRYSDDKGQRVNVDVIDLNGDGLPDLIDSREFNDKHSSPHWKVYWNTGNGFETIPFQFRAHRSYIARTQSRAAAYGLFDMNGDGLRDFVAADTDNLDAAAGWHRQNLWQVWFNTGAGFAENVTLWGAEDRNPLPNFTTVGVGSAGTGADMVDLNGDGLPDLVRRGTSTDTRIYNGYEQTCLEASCLFARYGDDAVGPARCCYNLLVWFNTGSSFAAPVPWSSQTSAVRAGHRRCPLSFSHCDGSSVWNYDLMDFNGDGLVDQIQRDNTRWRILFHPASPQATHSSIPDEERGPPNLLLGMMNGIGGATTMAWAPAVAFGHHQLPFARWVVADRAVWDGFANREAGRTSYEYEGGFYDATDREFRGFAMVRQREASGTVRESTFHQDDNRRGVASRVRVFVDSGGRDELIGVDEYEWPQFGPLLVTAHERVPWHEGASVPNLRVSQRYAYDAFGNRILTTTNTPLAGTSAIHAKFAHDVLDRANGVPRRYRIDRPTSSWATQGEKTAPLIEKRFRYKRRPPLKGILVSSSTCITWNDPGSCKTWSEQQFEHDQWGNVNRTRTPGGIWSETRFDDRGRFVAEYEQPAVGTTTSFHDSRTGQVVSTINPAGSASFSEYDAIGRLIKSWGPGQSAENPLVQRSYQEGDGDGTPGVSIVRELGRAPASVFHDGLGRVVATKTVRRTDEGDVTMVAGLQVRDDRGNVIRESLPQRAKHVALGTLSTNNDDIGAWVNFERDDRGRLHEVGLPDGTRTVFDRRAPGVVVRLSPSLVANEDGGSAVIRFFDGLDRQIAEDICDTTPTLDDSWSCPVGSLRSRMLWFYDGLDRTTEIQVADLDHPGRSAVTTTNYDGLSNRSQVRTADGALWRFTYNNDGRLIETARPDGRTVAQTWDTAGRLRAQTAGDLRSLMRYDSRGKGIGKISRIVSRSPAGSTSKRFGYDKRGRLVAEDWSINPKSDRSRRFRFEHQYDELDRRTATSYPTTQRRETEPVETSFNAYGQPASLSTPSTELLSDVGYDRFGNLTRSDYGNGLRDLNGYDPPGSPDAGAGVLRCMRTTAISQGKDACAQSDNDLRRLRYATYDADGRLRWLNDELHVVGDRQAATRHYRYDALGHLVDALYGDGSVEQFAFDSLGNPLRMGSGELEYAEPRTPHRPTFFVDQLPDRRSVEVLSYNEAGELVQRGARRYKYDLFGRLTEISNAGNLVQRRQYDESGNLVSIYDADKNSTRVLFGPWFEVHDADLIRHFRLGERHVASDISAAPPELKGRNRNARASNEDGAVTLRYFHGDHQNSPTLVTDAASAVVSRPRFRAFGGRINLLENEPADPAEPATPGFTGHRDDPGTGLLDMGARLYDPQLGMFTAPDPAQQYTSPYILGGGNPVLGRDADGRIFGLTAIGFAAAVTGTATFIDSLVQTGNLGASLTAGVFAGVATYTTQPLSKSIIGAKSAALPSWARSVAGLATVGLPLAQAARNLEHGRVAGAIATFSILAAAVTGAEQAGPPSPDSIGEKDYALQGIAESKDGSLNIVYSDGICATRPGCVTNGLIALRENLRLLFTQQAACVEGCDSIAKIVTDAVATNSRVHLQCNSFGAIKCLGALQKLGKLLNNVDTSKFSASLTGAPILRPPALTGVTYEANLFDPVTWLGTIYAIPFRADVTLGRSAFIPLPLVVHHPDFYMTDAIRNARNAGLR